MKEYFTIPCTSEPQRFSIVLAGEEYRLTVRWFDASEGGWHLDIHDVKGTPLLCGLPLVAGCNLLEQYDYLGIGGELWIDGEFSPSFEDLGTKSELVFVCEKKNETI